MSFLDLFVIHTECWTDIDSKTHFSSNMHRDTLTHAHTHPQKPNTVRPEQQRTYLPLSPTHTFMPAD